MIQRIEHETKPDAALITAAELADDLKRGYCILLYREAGELVIKSPHGHKVIRQVPQIKKFCCMYCKFDTVEGAYPPEVKDGSPRTGLDIIRAHVTRDQHPWAYRPYETPYGMLGDVKIEGVEDYTQYLKEISK